MQRVLPRGEIEGLEHTRVPSVYLPEPRYVFKERAARLRQLAAESSIDSYLHLMACVVDAQDEVFNSLTAITGPTYEQVTASLKHGLPPLGTYLKSRNPDWINILHEILQHVSSIDSIPADSKSVVSNIKNTLESNPDLINKFADSLINQEPDEQMSLAWAPFIMAALQVYFTSMAIGLGENAPSESGTFGVCPCCGGLPVASVVKIGGSSAGRRYVTCSLCSTEWHIVRVTCTHCENTEKVLYHAVEQGNEAIRAESCGSCGNYRKIFYKEKDHNAEAVADDLASIELDMLMGQEGFYRINDNPLLWLPRD